MFFVWLVSYGLVTILCHHFASLSQWAIPGGLLINTCTLLLFGGKPAMAGFQKPTHWKMHLFFLPYLLPVVYHLIRFGFSPPSVPGILGIFLAAVLEEVIFRGIFLRYCCRWGHVCGILLSSLAFAAAHLVNIENGVTPIFLLCQVVFALATGFALGGVALTCGSLLPCIGIHFLINLTAGDSPVHSDPLFWLCIAVYLACGIRSLYILNKSHQERVSI